MSLDELMQLPLEAQLDRLAASGNIETLLLDLVEQASQLITVESSNSIDVTRSLIALTDHADVPVARARARRARARALSYVGRFEEALAVSHEAVAIAERASDAIEAGRARLASMHALCELGRLDEATSTGETAREMLLQADQQALAARADINLGITYHRRDDPHAAVRCFERARPLLMSDRQVLGNLENSLGEALVAVNNFTAAERAYAAALRIFLETGQTLNAAIAEGNLAELASRQGRLATALRYFEQARRRFASENLGVHRARLLAEQAEAKAVLGLRNDALREYEQSLRELDAHGLVLEAARARNGIGLAYLHLGHFVEAETALAAAAVAFEDLGHTAARARVDLARSQLALARKRPLDAKRLALRAMMTLQDRPADAAMTRHVLALAAIQLGNYSVAHADVNAGIAIAEEIDLAPLLADLLQTRGDLLSRERRFTDAINAYQQSIEQVERLRGMLQADRFRSAFLGDRARIYEQLVDLLLDAPDRLDEAFQVAEMAKSRSLLDQVLRAATLDGADNGSPGSDINEAEKPLLDQLENTRAELSALYSRLGELHIGGNASNRAAQWRRAVATQERKLCELEDRLAATRSNPLLATQRPFIEIQQAVPQDAALIEYFQIGDSLMSFVITRSDVWAYRGLISRDDLQTAIEQLHFQIDRALRPGALNSARERRLCDDANEVLRELHDALLGPMLGRLASVKRLIIAPHGPLHLVPFHALYDGTNHVIDRWTVHCAPSANLFCELQQQRHANGHGAVIVGVNDGHLPQIEAEAQWIAEALQDNQPTTLLLNEQATAAALADQASTARLIHIACHGRFDEGSPMGSGIRLADRWLTLRDIERMRFQADLLTLSGCETGLASVARGDELAGIVRAGLSAGARSMLVSLWRINDACAAEMMCHFYKLWHTVDNHQNKADLWRKAQLAARSHRRHPACWGAFVMTGAL